MSARRQAITKEELRQVLIDWGQGRLSSYELRDWMEGNYYPLHLEVGSSEPEHTQRSMHLIMNEFELVSPPNFVPGRYKAAIKFLDASEQDYGQAEERFYEECFK